MAIDKPIPFDGIEEGDREATRTYHIDWEAGRITGYIDGVEAVKQFIKKAMLTPRFQCLIYDFQYGSEIQDTLIHKGVTQEYVEAELPFLVEDALIHDDRILKVSNVQVAFSVNYPEKDSVVIKFDVDTIFGQIQMEEVI